MPSWRRLLIEFLEINLTFLVFVLLLSLFALSLEFLGIDLWKIVAGILLSLGILSLVSNFVSSFIFWISHSIYWVLSQLHLNFLVITPLFFLKKIIAYVIYFTGTGSKRIRTFLDRSEGKILAFWERRKKTKGKSI